MLVDLIFMSPYVMFVHFCFFPRHSSYASLFGFQHVCCCQICSLQSNLMGDEASREQGNRTNLMPRVFFKSGMAGVRARCERREICEDRARSIPVSSLCQCSVTYYSLHVPCTLHRMFIASLQSSKYNEQRLYVMQKSCSRYIDTAHHCCYSCSAHHYSSSIDLGSSCSSFILRASSRPPVGGTNMVYWWKQHESARQNFRMFVAVVTVRPIYTTITDRPLLVLFQVVNPQDKPIYMVQTPHKRSIHAVYAYCGSRCVHSVRCAQ